MIHGLPISKNISASTSSTALILLSDVDEIPNLQTIQYIREQGLKSGKAYHLSVDMYYYDLSTQVFTEPWYHPQIMNVNDALNQKWTPQELRDVGFQLSRVTPMERRTLYPNHAIIHNGGWHLSYFGTDTDRHRKIQSFSHQEYNTKHVLKKIEKNKIEKKDPLGRKWQKLKTLHICNRLLLPLPVLQAPHLFGHLAPHCPTARSACHSHLINNFQKGILTFSSSKDYINGGYGGGITNQLVGIKNGLLIANAVQLPVMLPDAYTRLSWNDNQNVWKYKTIEFDVLFNSKNILADLLIAKNICVLTKKEVIHFGILNRTGTTQPIQLNVLDQANRNNWRFMNHTTIRTVVRNSIKTYQETNTIHSNCVSYGAPIGTVRANAICPIELWLGATSDLVWAKNTHTEMLSTHILNTMQFASEVQVIGNQIVAILKNLNIHYTGKSKK